MPLAEAAAEKAGKEAYKELIRSLSHVHSENVAKNEIVVKNEIVCKRLPPQNLHPIMMEAIKMK